VGTRSGGRRRAARIVVSDFGEVRTWLFACYRYRVPCSAVRPAGESDKPTFQLTDFKVQIALGSVTCCASVGGPPAVGRPVLTRICVHVGKV